MTISDQTFRVSLAKMLAGEKEIRGTWVVENADNYTPEQIGKMEDAAANWLD